MWLCGTAGGARHQYSNATVSPALHFLDRWLYSNVLPTLSPNDLTLLPRARRDGRGDRDELCCHPSRVALQLIYAFLALPKYTRLCSGNRLF